MNIVLLEGKSSFPGCLQKIKEKFISRGKVSVCTSAKELLDCSRERKPDVAVIDIDLPGEEGLEVLKSFRVLFPETYILLLAGGQNYDRLERALKLGADDYMVEPLVREELEIRLSMAIKSRTKSHTLKRIEEVFQEEEGVFRILAEHSVDWEYWMDPQENFVYVSPSCLQITGYDPWEFVSGSRRLEEIIHPQDQDIVKNHVSCLEDRCKHIPLEFRIIHRNGEEKWINHVCQPIYSSRGRFLGRRASNRDITRQKKAEKALRESEVKYRLLFDSANDAILLMENYVFIDCNEKALEVFGTSQDRILGRTPCEFSPEEQPDGSNSKNRALRELNMAQEGFPRLFEWKHIRDDGRIFDAEVSLNRIVLDNKTYIQSIVRDISDRKELYREIEERTRALEKSNRMLQELNQKLYQMEKSRRYMLANISHDLRTPITLIQGFVEALLEEVVTDPQEQRKYLCLILTKVKGLSRLIDELLQLTRLESGEVKMDYRKVTPEKLASWLFEKYRAAVVNKGIKYQVLSPSYSFEEKGQYNGLQVKVDYDGIDRVFSNLICNSIKFTPSQGSIVVSWEIISNKEKEGSSGVEKEVCFQVKDSGTGINEEDFPFIFDRFYQGSKSRNTGTGSRGLGLAIAREIIAQHGGRIWAESTPEEGSTFYFTLPLNEA